MLLGHFKFLKCIIANQTNSIKQYKNEENLFEWIIIMLSLFTICYRERQHYTGYFYPIAQSINVIRS